MPLGELGSSPLTRGALDPVQRVGSRIGLIPAHAGSTVSAPFEWRNTEAHPRSRGEHSAKVTTSLSASGSSPLTRGARRGRRPAQRRVRLIPAHAGSTTPSVQGDCHSPAHPRSRGEHHREPTRRRRRLGSSPLTRGARRMGVQPRGRGRLIPAHAGSTRGSRLSRGTRAAHPRSRGEHRSVSSPTQKGQGSSPLTRGAHLMICDFRAFVDPFLGILAAPVVVSRSCSYRDVGVPHPDLTVVPARSHRHIHPDEP